MNSDFIASLNLTTEIKPGPISIPDNECIKFIDDKFTTVEDLIEPSIVWVIATLGIKMFCFGKSSVDNAAREAQRRIIGEPGNKSALIERFEKKMNEVIQDAISKYVYDLTERIRHNIEEKCKRKIDGIIQNYDDYVVVKDELIALKGELKRIVNGE